ncbi:MAG TPA: class I adenylate-forming enzyme family protein [Geminicoccaceae bacterium]|nr:class I adenylate-forming enzyme family protein [Geminicoccaceae bacterium]
MGHLLTLHDPRTARRYYDAGVWQADTFYTLLARHAAERPQAFAARDGARRLTYAELYGWVDAIADAFALAGLRSGERVSLWLSNRLETLAAFLACARNGYVCNPSLHRNHRVEDVGDLLRYIDASAVLIEEGWGADAERQDQLADLPGLRRVWRLPRARAPGPELPGPEAGARGLAPVDDNPDKVAYLAFTSGTTGGPKAVLHSDNTLLANCRDLVRDWRHDHTTVLLSLSPLSHHIAWVAAGQALTAGMELVLDDPPAGMSRLDWLMLTGATYVMGVPTHAIDILAEQRRRDLPRLGRIRLFYMAGAPIPRAVAERFLEQGITPQNIYGMTESSSHHYTHPDDDADVICATCGRGGPAYEVRIFDTADPDRELRPGEVGQIGGRGGALMLGYYGNQAATERSFNKDGWFLSGDLGRLDPRGNLEIVGRLKDVVIRGGYNIHPAKVEELAFRHPQVARAAAFGLPDERLGERLCLAVSSVGDEPPRAEQMLRHLWELGLAIYDMPEYFVLLDDFPLTASGKILKRELAVWAREGRIAPEPCRFEASEPRCSSSPC